MRIYEAAKMVLPQYRLDRFGYYKATTVNGVTYDAGCGMLGDVLKSILEQEWWYGETRDIYDAETGEVVWCR